MLREIIIEYIVQPVHGKQAEGSKHDWQPTDNQHAAIVPTSRRTAKPSNRGKDITPKPAS